MGLECTEDYRRECCVHSFCGGVRLVASPVWIYGGVLGQSPFSFLPVRMINSWKPQIIRYGAAAVVASVLEAFSVQNDNLTLPLYMWSMLALVDV